MHLRVTSGPQLNDTRLWTVSTSRCPHRQFTHSCRTRRPKRGSFSARTSKRCSSPRPLCAHHFRGLVARALTNGANTLGWSGCLWRMILCAQPWCACLPRDTNKGLMSRSGSIAWLDSVGMESLGLNVQTIYHAVVDRFTRTPKSAVWNRGVAGPESWPSSCAEPGTPSTKRSAKASKALIGFVEELSSGARANPPAGR